MPLWIGEAVIIGYVPTRMSSQIALTEEEIAYACDADAINTGIRLNTYMAQRHRVELLHIKTKETDRD